MRTGVTSSGFEYKIEEEALDDYELLETLSQIDSGQSALMPKMIEQLLGKEQKCALMDHVRGLSKNGRVSTTKMFNEVSDIFDGCKEVKN